MLMAIVYRVWFVDDMHSTWLERADVDLDSDSLLSKYIQERHLVFSCIIFIFEVDNAVMRDCEHNDKAAPRNRWTFVGSSTQEPRDVEGRTSS
jgi:hypothetical protein